MRGRADGMTTRARRSGSQPGARRCRTRDRAGRQREHSTAGRRRLRAARCTAPRRWTRATAALGTRRKIHRLRQNVAVEAVAQVHLTCCRRPPWEVGRNTPDALHEMMATMAAATLPDWRAWAARSRMGLMMREQSGDGISPSPTPPRPGDANWHAERSRRNELTR